jgi:hypothetical protein
MQTNWFSYGRTTDFESSNGKTKLSSHGIFYGLTFEAKFLKKETTNHNTLVYSIRGRCFFWLGVGYLLVTNTLLLLNKKLSLQPNQSVGSVVILEFGFSNPLRCIQPPLAASNTQPK